jgi:hypothetical protein
MDLFSVDAAEGIERRTAARHASVLAHQRVAERFAAFVQAAATDEERALRYYLMEQDVVRTVQAACEECGHEDVEPVLAAVEQHLAGGAFCDDCRKWKTGPKGLCTCGEGENTDEPEQESAVGDKESRTASEATGLSDKPSGPGLNRAPAEGLKPIDTDGGPFKTEQQDIVQGPDYANEDFTGQANGALKHNTDITKDTNPSADGAHTDQWTGTKGQAKPVTSSYFLSEDAIQRALDAR